MKLIDKFYNKNKKFYRNYADYGHYQTLKKYLDPDFIDPVRQSIEQPLDKNDPNDVRYHYMPDETYEDDYVILKNKTNPLQVWNGGPEIEYRWNRSGFRSQHFENFNSNDTNILFSGCSWTFGDGLPDNMVWRSLLTNEIQNKFPDKNVQQYNLANGGDSIPLIFKNVLAFLRKYDGVDYVYILLPGFDRQVCLDYKINNGNVGFRKVVYVSPEDSHIFNIPSVKKFAETYVLEESLYMVLPLIRAIEDICQLKGIKLFWGSWLAHDQDVYKDFNFNNYVEIPIWEYYYSREQTVDKEYYKIAGDGSHPGLKHMMEISDAFYKHTFKDDGAL